MEKTPDGLGWRAREWASRRGELRLEIDVQAVLAYLGPKALKSKGGRSAALDGAVRCIRESYRDIPNEKTVA